MEKICLDSRAYSIRAIRRAVYEFRETAEAEIFSCDDDKIVVVLGTKKGSGLNGQNAGTQFKQLALDHQVRIDIEDEYKPIRQIILAQAFFPCSNLEDIFEAAKE